MCHSRVLCHLVHTCMQARMTSCARVHSLLREGHRKAVRNPHETPWCIMEIVAATGKLCAELKTNPQELERMSAHVCAGAGGAAAERHPAHQLHRLPGPHQCGAVCGRPLRPGQAAGGTGPGRAAKPRPALLRGHAAHGHVREHGQHTCAPGVRLQPLLHGSRSCAISRVPWPLSLCILVQGAWGCMCGCSISVSLSESNTGLRVM